MQIIDPNTGKRLDQERKDIKKTLNKLDPVMQNNAEKVLEDTEHSPMDPPDALSDENTLKGLHQEYVPLLQSLMEEHKEALEHLQDFEKAITEFKSLGYKYTEAINLSFSNFFEFFDQKLLAHNQKEEKKLFPLLHERLIASGEHSQELHPTTGVDIMEDDHVKFIQLGALTFNLLGLATRLPDEQSRMIINDVAYHNGRELIEILRLHIFREDNTLFPLAQSLISTSEFNELEKA